MNIDESKLKWERIALTEIEHNAELFSGFWIEKINLIYDNVPDGILLYTVNKNGHRHVIDISVPEHPGLEIDISIAHVADTEG